MNATAKVFKEPALKQDAVIEDVKTLMSPNNDSKIMEELRQLKQNPRLDPENTEKSVIRGAEVAAHMLQALATENGVRPLSIADLISTFECLHHHILLNEVTSGIVARAFYIFLERQLKTKHAVLMIHMLTDVSEGRNPFEDF